VAQSPESFAYDFDGNLLGDGRWTYTWDAENRLIALETQTAAVTAGVLRQKLEYAYDAQGRRIQKKVSNWNSASSAYQLLSDTRFVYDGWNLLAELNGLSGNAVVRTYVWGLDLSGSAQGAGGVGGLLAVSASGSTYATAYDGNGNLVSLINAVDGSDAADFEYDPFGGLIRATGAVIACPFQFSTKYTDAEAGLVYYGLRYYNPTTGRWLSRDPIEEQGGANLYGTIGNDLIDRWDILGLEAGDEKHPLGKCDGSQSCAKNIAILRKFIQSTRIRLQTDFTDSFKKLADERAPIPVQKQYSPNVTDYLQSWNNHRGELITHLGHVSNCLAVIYLQRARGECRCCDPFFPKQYRWAEQFRDRVQNNIPPVMTVSSGWSPGRIVTGGVVIIGGVAVVAYFVGTPPGWVTALGLGAASLSCAGAN
jgi:RHS repeat-associated protein